MSTLLQPRSTPEEYLALERESPTKSEFINGRIYATAGASYRHDLVVGNIFGELRTQLRGRPCRVLSSDMRVKVSATGLYTYPDVSGLCDEPRLEDEHLDTLLNPSLIIEVLSRSTEAYDRGEKFAHYRQLESLREYVLVAQDRIRVERYTRQGEQWLLSEFSTVDSVVPLESIGCTLAIREVYEQVDFIAAES